VIEVVLSVTIQFCVPFAQQLARVCVNVFPVALVLPQNAQQTKNEFKLDTMFGGIERKFALNRCWIIAQFCDHFTKIMINYSLSLFIGVVVFEVIHP
jgi:hypothetical protein